MMKRIVEGLSKLVPTIIGGIFLAASLILMLSKVTLPVDPAWVTIAICGFPIFYYAATTLFIGKRITSSLLISIAVVASVVIGEFFAAGEVAFIMAVGAFLQEKTVERARKGIENLLNIVPAQARRISDGKEEMTPIEQVRVEDILRVLPGEIVPVDGEIVSGDTSIDQSVITGESLPVDKSVGDSVFCGTINRFGSVDIKAAKVGEDSSLQKLIRMVQEAEKNKAPTQSIADKWASRLVPIALVIAAIAGLATQDITRAVTILVVFCPCSLVLATPTSIIAAIGQAAKNGVLIKSGDALERMGKVDCIAFDKTGTLTHGSLTVSDVIPFVPDISEESLLLLTASAEARSEHPLGKAIVAYADREKYVLQEARDFRMIPGQGICANIDGRWIRCGNDSYLRENGVSFEKQDEEMLETLRSQGKATVLVAQDDKCVGMVALSDTLRDSAPGMVSELKQAHADTVLLTGDNSRTAEYFAERAGISDMYAELLPAQKVEHIKTLQNKGYRVCMVGDGVNDAPALKTAYVGVAMGGQGSDIAVEAADIALMGDDIGKLPYLKRLSNATVKLIKVNITLSMSINFVAILLSLFALLNPITGALVHNAGSVLVVLNAALLYDRKYT